MRKLLPLLLLLGLALPAIAAPQGSTPAFPYPLKVDRLPNGLTVARVPFNSPGLVAYYTVVRVGSRNEVEPGKTGFAHFFEHMMFKGTKTHPEGDRERILGTYGFDDNAYTTDDFTVYHSYGPSTGLMSLIELEADRFRNLEYSEPSFRTEALAVLGEYHKNAARPELKMEEALLSTAFTQHTYRHTTLGFYEDIKAMPEQYDYSRTFFERWYTPDNTLLIIAGDFDDAQLMEAVREHYGPWNSKPAQQVAIPREPTQRGMRTVHVDWEQPTLPRHKLAWHTPAATLKTQAAAIQAVLVPYLVGPTSPLHKELVLEKQFAEQVGSDFYEHRDPYLFTLTAVLKREEDRAKVNSAMLKAVRDLASNKVDVKRLEAIKSNLRYSLPMGLETAKDVGGVVAWYAGIFGSPDAVSQHYESISKVTARQLVDFAKEYLTANNLTVISLTPKASGGQQ